ncbi:hypothetical protein FRB93_000244 [Tulasnella sp. JGI-2019a]|nr:hypothetical protein FRB93_000244 [Tulasnella sp. JGI-2019a]
MATTSSAQLAQARFLADVDPPICSMEVAKAFELLTAQEKLYAHYIGKASWAGARIIQGQWTPYAQRLYDLLILIFSKNDKKTIADLKTLQNKAGLNAEEWKDFTEYSAQVLSNLVNYKSFGFSKFIPRVRKDKFALVVEQSENKAAATELWGQLSDHIYSLEPEASLLVGKPSAGHLSNYYLGETIQDDEVEMIQKESERLGLAVENTRVRKNTDGSFDLLIASASHEAPKSTKESTVASDSKVKVKVKYGDFSEPLRKSATALEEAKKYAANDIQRRMLEGYAKSFISGSIEEHKEASTEWVKDIGPVVESYIGFIEASPPSSTRSSPRSTTNSSMTRLSSLKFFHGAKPMKLIYYEVREKTGFKNVSLANILAAKAPNEEITFIHPDDLKLYKTWDTRAFELQVANHELLGHGSGKLFQEDSDGKFNFDKEKARYVILSTINPLTGKPVTSWYRPGQTPGTVLGAVSSSFEECRAETVALYLVSNQDILNIFGYTDKKEAEDIQFITFLLMARAGLRALELWDPKAKKHLQAHMQARLGITNFLINEGVAKLTEVRGKDGQLENAYIRVDRETVLKRGREIVGKLLIDLQVRKSTADGEGATKFYTELTNPKDGWDGELRDLVLRKKQPRKIFLQPNTVVVGEGDSKDVQLKEYPLTCEGIIESFIERDI